jgi:signal transduction histidine kinase
MGMPEEGCPAPVLVLAPLGRDASVICSMLEDADIAACRQSTLAELASQLDRASAAVIAEEALIHEDRTALARWILEQPPWSDFPFILLTLRTSQNSRGLPELIEILGNVTVLERPLAATSLSSAARAAMRARARQRQAEHYLNELKDWAGELERRVAQRTHELSEANKRLMAEMAERERTEAALRHAQKMEAVGQLTGGIAHDFNNLLMAISGNLELLSTRIDDQRLQRYLGSAMHAARRGATLVEQLLAFSRKQQLEPESVDINGLIGGIEELISRTIGSPIRVVVVPHANLPPARVDPTQLELMILNLAINARDAMPSGGTLTIETSKVEVNAGDLPDELSPGSYVAITVSDTGYGMTPDVLARAFDPFFTTKAQGKGTGLGLSQVYGFARQSGGTVKIESKVGIGTRVRIYLPRSVETTDADDDQELNESEARRATILVVDDDADVLESVCGMLDDRGYKVLSANSGEAALGMINDGKIDLALVDIAMPVMNGIDLAAQLRRRLPDLRILLCSGYPELVASHADRLRGEQLIAKPCRGRDLSAKINAVLKQN